MVVLRTPARKAIFLTAVLLVVAGLLIFFLLVRNNAVSKNTAPASASSHTTAANSSNAAAAATAAAYMKLVTIIGQPTVKMVSGTTFQADGQVNQNACNRQAAKVSRTEAVCKYRHVTLPIFT